MCCRVPIAGAVPARPGLATPGEYIADRACRLGGKPGVPAAQVGIRVPQLLQTPEVDRWAPVCGRWRPEPTVANGLPAVPGARSGLFREARKARENCARPTGQKSEEAVQIPAMDQAWCTSKAILPGAGCPVFRLPCPPG